MPDVLKSLTVALAASTLTQGQTTTAKATPVVEVTDGALDDNFPLTWSSSNPAVATVAVTPTGVVVTAVGGGTATITAAHGAIFAGASLTVAALPTVKIDAAGEATIEGLAIGASFVLKGPTKSYLSQKQP